MSSVPLKDADDQVFRPDTFTRTEGGNTVHMQAVVPVDPATGDPLAGSTEATLAALKAAIDALNAKVTAVNTGAVTLDSATLTALETISVANFTDNGLTDAQLRADPVAVIGVVALDASSLAALETVSIGGSLPLPTGAATEATLAALDAKLPELSGGRLPVELPSGGGGLTDAELRATPVPVSGSFSASVTPDDTAALIAALIALVHPIWEETSTGRLRVVLDPTGGAQTLSAVTTVGTVTTCSTVTTVATVTNVTSLNQVAGVSAASYIYDQMHAAWAAAVLPRIT